MITYICKKCNLITSGSECDICGSRTSLSSRLYWCEHCNVPTYHEICPKCGNKGFYFTTDARPVFPEERLLIEAVLGEPMKFYGNSVWNSNGIYFVDGKRIRFSIEKLTDEAPEKLRAIITKHKDENSYDYFNANIKAFTEANKLRYDDIASEAIKYIIKASEGYDSTSMFVSFSVLVLIVLSFQLLNLPH